MTIIPSAPNLNEKMRKFRFIVINSGPDGQMSTREQPQIGMAPNPQYLVNLYAQCGDKIRILEELPQDEETKQYGKLDIGNLMSSNKISGLESSGSLVAGTMITTDGISDEQIKALGFMHGCKQNFNNGTSGNQQEQECQTKQPENKQSVHSLPTQQTQPTYFKIGSVECKMENGKVYQKQWMRVNDNEMLNYRLISDKNNKILPMVGKHLEVLRWTLSEDDSNV